MNRILQDDFFVLGESNFNQDKIEKARQIWPNIALHGTYSYKRRCNLARKKNLRIFYGRSFGFI